MWIFVGYASAKNPLAGKPSIGMHPHDILEKQLEIGRAHV